MKNKKKVYEKNDGILRSSIDKNEIKPKENKQILVGNPKLEKVMDIEIIDTGEGITAERQSLLFIPFLELK